MSKTTLIFSLFFLSFGLKTGWETNLDLAKEKAVKEEKYILLNFSGSDWCGSCIKLDRELFEKDTFIGYANKNLILLNADFPQKKKNGLSAEQVKHNELLAEKHNPNGSFPKTVILNSKGEEIGEMAYPCKDAGEYINSINKLIK